MLTYPFNLHFLPEVLVAFPEFLQTTHLAHRHDDGTGVGGHQQVICVGDLQLLEQGAKKSNQQIREVSHVFHNRLSWEALVALVPQHFHDIWIIQAKLGPLLLLHRPHNFTHVCVLLMELVLWDAEIILHLLFSICL